jgi:hypothetical protein
MYRFRECLEFLERGVRIRCQNLASKVVLGGVLHERRVFHFFYGDGMDDGVCLVLPRPMVVAEGDGHVGCVHSAEVVL